MGWLKNRLEREGMEAKIKQMLLLRDIADNMDATLPQLALAWCLANSNVSTVITGASKPEQIDENMKALTVVPRLTPDVLKRIDDIMGNKPAANFDWREN